MGILDTIKGKTVFSFEVINTICSRMPSVYISELFSDTAKLTVPAWCLLLKLRTSLIEQCGSGVYCLLNVTHSSWYIN